MDDNLQNLLGGWVRYFGRQGGTHLEDRHYNRIDVCAYGRELPQKSYSPVNQNSSGSRKLAERFFGSFRQLIAH